MFVPKYKTSSGFLAHRNSYSIKSKEVGVTNENMKKKSDKKVNNTITSCLIIRILRFWK